MSERMNPMDTANHRYATTCREAVTEIERLRAALLAIITSDPLTEADDWFKEWRRLVFHMKGIARAALAFAPGARPMTEDEMSAMERATKNLDDEIDAELCDDTNVPSEPK